MLLDDDQDVLELYRDVLARLPSRPEIVTATTGARAIALLESQPFSLLISDLNMPRMDGLQVLTIVRRKFPKLRTAVLTSVVDEQFRTRAYSLGIDLFIEKPHGAREMQFMLDCVEGVLGRDEVPGFRGVQSKSLVDILQLECLSQSSSVLKITQGLSEGRIWILNGEIIDSECDQLGGEEAFRRILSWKSGTFETLHEDPTRPRKIFTSTQGLLLETAQAIDEAQSVRNGVDESGQPLAQASPLASLADRPGVEMIVSACEDPSQKPESWGAEDTDQIAEWTRRIVRKFRDLGDALEAGNFNRLDGTGTVRHVTLVPRGDRMLCVGFNRSLSPERIRESLKSIISQWAS